MKAITIEQEKIRYRRKQVYLLKIRRYKNQEIANKVGVSLSTIEKDLKELRYQLKDWFIEVARNDYVNDQMNHHKNPSLCRLWI